MSNKYFVTPMEVQLAASNFLVNCFKSTSGQKTLASVPLDVYGIPRGGVPAAFSLLNYLPRGSRLVDNPAAADIIVDDIYDSGKTLKRYEDGFPEAICYALFDKRDPQWKDKWLVMPWETTDDKDDSGTDIVTRLLQYIGENPDREGLRETPERVLKAWQERTSGYQISAEEIMKSFEDGAKGCDELVIVHNIPVISVCEHHLADIIGHAHVGYIPNGRIIGLSKVARLVDMFSRRLQVQEQLTIQVADALQDHLNPLGVGVLIRAAHGCMSTRGVKVHGSTTTTSAMRGALMEKSAARKEFMDLCMMAEQDRNV